MVVNKKADSRTCWDLSTWNNTCFLFKCRVTFWLRYFSDATFGTLALYILRLRCLAIPNTYKNSFWFFRKPGLRRFVLYAIVLMIFVQTFRKIMGDLTERKTPTFQIEVEYVPKMSVWALLCIFLWFQLKNMFWELPEVSLLGTIRVFHSNAESRFGFASSRRLRLVLWLFTSCVGDVLWYRILIKTTFVSWAKQKLSKTTLSTFQKCLLNTHGLVASVVTKRAVLRTSSDLSTWNNTSFYSNAESRFGCARFRRLRLVLWLVTSCVWDVLWYRILIKTAFVSWAKQKLSKTTLSTIQKCLFELWSAWFFGCK